MATALERAVSLGSLTTVEAIEARGARHREPRRGALSVRGVSKSFPLHVRSATTVKQHLRHPFGGRAREQFDALRELSFEVEAGEFFAIVGGNGSGKSTLLRCIADIYEPDAGEIDVRGRIAPFIELGASFHPELKARENVVLVATLIGLRPSQARRRSSDIIQIAELEEFVDMPVKNYSAGMEARLAFATAIQVDADVLLFDEALDVGDIAFQEKSFETFEALRTEGRTVLYVSHKLSTVRRLADRALLLENGRQLALGEPEAVIEEYVKRSRASQGRQIPRSAPAPFAANAGYPPTPSTPLPDNGAPPSRSRGRVKARLRRFWDATVALAIAEFRIRYLDSALGYLWALGEPLLMFTVLYFVFSQVVHLQSVPHYPVKLLLGVVLFGFFTESTVLAMTSLVTRANLLRRIAFPASAVPLSSTLTTTLTFGINLGVALIFALLSGIVPTALWLELIPLLLLLLATATGASLVLALLYVSLRDVRQIWGVATRMLFFATPVFYSVQAVPEAMRHVMMLNPLAVVVVQANHALIDSQAPTAASASGGIGWLAIPIALAIAMPCVGGWLFARSRSLPERI